MAQIRINVKTPAPFFFQNNLTSVIQMIINVFPRIVFVRKAPWNPYRALPWTQWGPQADPRPNFLGTF
jgi:hypothetical protein